MARPLFKKIQLWRDIHNGAKSRILSATHEPALKREDVPDVVVNKKIDRGDRLQKLRLKYYPSINIPHDKLFAGKIKGDIEDAEGNLVDMGFRNNPTAYVEITEEHGPDDGSYSQQIVTETGGRFDLPKVTRFPSFYRRVKDQIHVTIYKVGEEVEFLAHREQSAWLQPARHVFNNDSNALRGVRDFRDKWFDHFGEEMPGKSNVMWDVSH